MKKPKLIKRISKNGQTIFNLIPEEERIISIKTANNIREMMNKTVHHGTARSSYSRFLRKNSDAVEIGGKTGSLTGGDPFGKRDWFVSFIKSKDNNDVDISLGVVMVNKKKWKVRSSQISKIIAEYYFKKMTKKKNMLTKGHNILIKEGV